MTAALPTWIIFDAADTLLRAEPSVASVYQQVARRHGVTVSTEEIEQRFQPAVQKHFASEASDEQLDRERWQSLVFEILKTDKAQIFADLWDHFAQPGSWRLFEDVRPTWEWLEQQGFQLAIASNFDARLIQIIASLTPVQRARHVFLSSQLGFRKPSLRFFRAIEHQLGPPPDQLMLVGDSHQADFAGARDAGWQALHLDRSQTTCWPRIASLQALPQFLPMASDKQNKS